MSTLYTDAHIAWKQRLGKEINNKQRYVEKGYKNGFDHKKGPWIANHKAQSDMVTDYKDDDE